MLTLSKTPGDLDCVDFILHQKHLDQVDFLSITLLIFAKA
jgi:hypothetical protein